MPPYKNNPASLFQLFNQDNEDTSTKVMQKIGVASFTVAFGATLLDQFWKNNRLIIAGYAFGYVLGIFMFAIVGIKLVGRQKGRQSFLGQLAFVLSRVFLFILLPSLLLTLALVIYAIASHQW